jgi:hypothetical protein
MNQSKPHAFYAWHTNHWSVIVTESRSFSHDKELRFTMLILLNVNLVDAAIRLP